MTKATNLPYRPCAGIMIVNRDGKVFVGQRVDATVEAWQMPQGGIDKGETPLDAAIREVGEETGIAAHLLTPIARAPRDLRYDLPEDLIGKIWKGKYRGQEQAWFLMAFSGTDADVDIMTSHQEFRAWRWAEPAELPDLIVPFKRALYEEIVATFAPLLPLCRN